MRLLYFLQTKPEEAKPSSDPFDNLSQPQEKVAATKEKEEEKGDPFDSLSEVMMKVKLSLTRFRFSDTFTIGWDGPLFQRFCNMFRDDWINWLRRLL